MAAAAGALVLALASVARAESHRDLALAYGRGDNAAAERVRSLSRAELRADVKWLREMRACAQCGERELADHFPFLGAVLLHTDRAMRDDQDRRVGDRDFHLDLARELFEIAPAPVQRLEPRWFLVVGHHFLRYIEPPEAHRYFAAGAARFPEDARFRVGDGAAYEEEARLAPPPDVVFSGSKADLRVALDASAARHQALVRAEAEFRRALDLSPDSAEARLRRGRVLIDLGRRSEAVRELGRVTAQVTAGDLHALAALFLGLAAEMEGRWEEAARLYRQAAEAAPRGSRAAAVALAHALDEMGATAEAQATVDAMLAHPAARDPFDGYVTGPAGEMERLVEELRAAAREEAR